jgi:hypothetical protein
MSVSQSRLHEPVGRFARPVPVAESNSSIERAVEKMRSAGIDAIPITEGGRLVGILTQASLLKVLEQGADLHEAVGKFAAPVDRLHSGATGAEALRKLEWSQNIVVVDHDDQVVGQINASSFIGIQETPARPPLVGGMATPFGVYLTNGSVSGGKKGLALVATGSFLFLFFMSGRLLSMFLAPYLPEAQWVSVVLELFPVLALMATFRYLPIAGYHGAEHQVVHALEQGEELVPEVVARMPRVHPRCGTNLAVGATMFLTIQQAEWIKSEEIRLLIAMLTTLFFWRPIGSFMQQWVTTRVPKPRELQSGIEAAKELLNNYAVAEHRSASPFKRILNSGMLHVMSGSILAYVVVSLVAWAFGVEPGAL